MYDAHTIWKLRLVYLVYKQAVRDAFINFGLR